MQFSLVVNHTPWVPERVQAKAAMLLELVPLSMGIPFFLHDADYRGRDWQGGGKRDWILAQWRWAVEVGADYAVFMTDDLHLAPGFWRKLRAMLTGVRRIEDEVKAAVALGLLSNHPAAPALAADDHGPPFYATNSWLVGPAYVLPRAMLAEILAAYEALPDASDLARVDPSHSRGKTGADSWNDDNFINEWVSTKGPGLTLHPVPTIIEHRDDLESTVGHGDEHSRERVSWRAMRRAVHANNPKGFAWHTTRAPERILSANLGDSGFWTPDPPAKVMLGWPTKEESIAPVLGASEAGAP